MSKYKKVGSGSYGVYEKQSNTGAVIGWTIFGLIVLIALAS